MLLCLGQKETRITTGTGEILLLFTKEERGARSRFTSRKGGGTDKDRKRRRRVLIKKRAPCRCAGGNP